MAKDRILVIGAAGQLGTELTEALISKYGSAQVIASDLRERTQVPELFEYYEPLDVLDQARLGEIINQYHITHIYHLAAMLSATGEKYPKKAWHLNMQGLLNVLDASLEKKVAKVYFPSSIAVFGPTTPKDNTPQFGPIEPTTVYGISKQAGEGWCNYYFNKYGLDIRSLRYPGLIGYKALPGGGTTDYAVDIYHKALSDGAYECFLKADTFLPMMYMDDATRATLELMEAPAENIKIRTSYNLGGISFSPEQIAESIKKYIPEFTITYQPDERQAIADSWPNSIDDSAAKEQWGWEPHFELDRMTQTMLENLRIEKQAQKG